MAIGTNNLSGRVNVLNEATTTLVSYNNVVGGGSSTVFTLSDNYLINKLPDRVQINDPTLWKKIVLACTPTSGNQFKSLTFRRSSGTMKCTESWSTYSIRGTWSIDKIYVVNLDGFVLEVDGANFSSDTITVV